jgi:hypothetical protein
MRQNREQSSMESTPTGRYSIRCPFAADVEMLELQSGTRVNGVTSDISVVGCFVCTRRTLEVRSKVQGMLTHEGQQVKLLAVVRVVKPQGMGIEFVDIDPDTHATLLAWIERLRNSC